MGSRGELVQAWLRYNADRRENDVTDPDWWAVDELMDLVLDDPDEAWNLMVDLVRAADTEWQLTMIGCGVLEDLLRLDPERYLDALDTAAKTDRNLVTAVAHVWLDHEPAGPRIAALLKRYNQPRL